MICTGYVERQNFNVRLLNRRFTGLTIGLSKKLAGRIYGLSVFSSPSGETFTLTATAVGAGSHHLAKKITYWL